MNNRFNGAHKASYLHHFNFLLLLVSAVFIMPLQAEESPVEKRVGVLYWSSTIEGQVAMRKGIEEVLEGSEVPIRYEPLVAGDGAQGIRNQIKQMKAMVQSKPDIIIVQPTNNAVLKDSLIEANQHGIPVVAYDQYILGGTLASFVTSDNFQAGYLNGEYVASSFDQEYEVKIVMVESPSVSSTIDRVEGFLAALKNNSQRYKILKTYEAVEPVAGKIAGETIIKDFPKRGSIDVVFSVNDGGGLSMVTELQKAKRFEILHATVDGDPISIKNITKDKGITQIDSAQFCAELGRVTARTALQILNGEKVPYQILVPTFPVTKETLQSYSGWYGIPINKLELPWNQKNWEYKLKAKH